MSDNGRVFTTPLGIEVTALESELLALGIISSHGKPYHPQTEGKVERYHQMMKYLARQEAATTKKQLQVQLDAFGVVYNT